MYTLEKRQDRCFLWTDTQGRNWCRECWQCTCVSCIQQVCLTSWSHIEKGSFKALLHNAQCTQKDGSCIWQLKGRVEAVKIIWELGRSFHRLDLGYELHKHTENLSTAFLFVFAQRKKTQKRFLKERNLFFQGQILEKKKIQQCSPQHLRYHVNSGLTQFCLAAVTQYW